MAGVINYKWPVLGTFTPSSIAMSTVNTLTALVVFTDGDTGVTLVHNMGASFQAGYNGGASQPASDLANLFPKLTMTMYSQPTTTAFFAPDSIVNSDSNTVIITKTAFTGSAHTVSVTVERSTTLTR